MDWYRKTIERYKDQYLAQKNSNCVEKKKLMTYKMNITHFAVTNIIMLSCVKLIIMNHYGRYNILVKTVLSSCIYYYNEPLIILSSSFPLLYDSFKTNGETATEEKLKKIENGNGEEIQRTENGRSG